jgi:hypothetical protein
MGETQKMTTDFNKNVFINCPFDRSYTIPLLRPILFTIIYLGYNPRIALERFDSGEARISKIFELIETSKLSIHDISRMRSTRKSEYFRLNLAFELGIDIGCRLFKDGLTKNKKCLILEKDKYAYQKALSDLSNSDIKNHNNKPEKVIRHVRNWFVNNEIPTADNPTLIWDNYNLFMLDFDITRKKEGWRQKDLESMPIPEFMHFVREWTAGKVKLNN